jgi:hypothetical protein
MNVSHGAALRRPLVVAVLAAGLLVAGCGGNASNAPATSPACAACAGGDLGSTSPTAAGGAGLDHIGMPDGDLHVGPAGRATPDQHQ